MVTIDKRTKTISAEQYKLWQEYRSFSQLSSPLEKQLRKIKKEREIAKQLVQDKIFGRSKTVITPHGSTIARKTVSVTPSPYSYEIMKEV